MKQDCRYGPEGRRHARELEAAKAFNYMQYGVFRPKIQASIFFDVLCHSVARRHCNLGFPSAVAMCNSMRFGMQMAASCTGCSSAGINGSGSFYGGDLQFIRVENVRFGGEANRIAPGKVASGINRKAVALEGGLPDAGMDEPLA
jgi:hypothetical protein